MFTHRKPPNRHASLVLQKHGGIVAELAIVLPLLSLITFGSIQVANVIHFKQALTTAVFEGTRIATGLNGDRERIESRVKAMLDARGVKEAQIQILPTGDLMLVPAGAPVTISVTAPVNINVQGPGFVPFTKTITATGRTVR